MALLTKTIIRYLIHMIFETHLKNQYFFGIRKLIANIEKTMQFFCDKLI